MLKVSVPRPVTPLSHAFTVKCAVLMTPSSRNGPTASNSAPWLGVAQKLELERNAVNELASSMSPLASMAWNLPCTPDASDVTSKLNVITPPSGMVPVPDISPVWGGGGWFHACSLGLSGSRASVHAAASTSSAAAAADAPREMVGFMELPSWSDGFASPCGKTRTGCRVRNTERRDVRTRRSRIARCCADVSSRANGITPDGRGSCAAPSRSYRPRRHACRAGSAPRGRTAARRRRDTAGSSARR